MRKKLLLIDGNNLAHRNHHAQNLSTSSGQATGMTYGTINSILMNQREIRADHTVIVWDSPGGSTYRKNLYRLYKGSRSEKEQTFLDEMQTLRQLLHALGVIQVAKAGAECDDIIGYLATETYKDCEVYILSNDKDFLQLCSPTVHVVHPDKGAYLLENGKITFKDGTKYISIRPDQIPSYKALAGDTSDEYPGIAGFGIGAAINFFEKNDHCLSIVDGTANLSNQRSQALNGILIGRGMIGLFLKLATISMEEGEVPTPIKPTPNRQVVAALFDQLEFNQFKALGEAIYIIGGTHVD